MIRRKIDLYGGKAPAMVPQYTVPEAAHHLRLPTATVRAWVSGRMSRSADGRKQSAPLILAAEVNPLLLSFNNLAEIHVLSVIRKVHGVKLGAVRRAVTFLRGHFQSEQPLIETAFLTDGKDLFVKHVEEIVSVSGSGQMMFKWIDLFLDRIDRDKKGRPIRLYPFTRKDERESPKIIAIDPRISFGRPCIADTDIPTAILGERHEAGDSVEELAQDYGRPRSEIEEAIRYERRSAG